MSLCGYASGMTRYPTGIEPTILGSYLYLPDAVMTGASIKQTKIEVIGFIAVASQEQTRLKRYQNFFPGTNLVYEVITTSPYQRRNLGLSFSPVSFSAL